MIAITGPEDISRYQLLMREMVDETEPFQFSSDWIRSHNWKVVPVEDTAHLSQEELAILVPALRRAGITQGLAIATEPVDPIAPCGEISISVEEFEAFNKQYGVFRCMVTDEQRSWAISCNEWYNLYAGPVDLLESMLGKTIAEAREEFQEFLDVLKTKPDEPLQRTANRYAEL